MERNTRKKKKETEIERVLKSAGGFIE